MKRGEEEENVCDAGRKKSENTLSVLWVYSDDGKRHKEREGREEKEVMGCVPVRMSVCVCIYVCV